MSNSRFSHVSLSIALILFAQFFSMAFALHVVSSYGAESMDDFGAEEIVSIAPFTVGRFTSNLLLPNQTFIPVAQIAAGISRDESHLDGLAVPRTRCSLPEHLCRNDLWLVHRTLLI
jgi:hypothetical protein